MIRGCIWCEGAGCPARAFERCSRTGYASLLFQVCPGEADFLPAAVLGSATDLRLLLLLQGLTGKAFHEGGAETCGLLSFRVTINKFYMFARAEARLLRRLHG